MDEARKKLRIGLLFLVLIAVLMGVLYSVTDIGKQEDISEGTLVEVSYEWEDKNAIG